MGRRFGKKNKVSLNWYDYNLGLIGESGVGKTSIAYNICDKYLGEDGYILLNIGLEDGVDALPNVIYEDVEDWDKFADIVDDIVENKDKYYPDLKLIVFDTMDELIKLSQDDIIRQHNRQNPNKRINTIRAAFGGLTNPRESSYIG